MKKLFILVLLLGVASSAWASNDWSTAATSSDWFTAANWSSGTVPVLVPSTNTRTYQTQANATYMPIINSGAALSHQLDIGGGPHATSSVIGTVTLNGAASTLTVTDYFRIGSSSTSNRWGAFYMNGGTVTVGGYMAVGYGATTTDLRGWLYMTGGTINVTADLRFANASGASAWAYVTGGTINAGSLNMRPAGTTGTPTTLLDISGGGKVVLNGDVVATVLGYRDNGWILSGGEEFLDEWVTYDAGTNKTTLVPEPATLCLLGLGALSLIRRKR